MRFLRINEVKDKVGLSRPTIWRLERAGEFPKRRQLGSRSVGWVEDEIEQWMQSRVVVADDSGDK
jgi:prophage regulatory protein